MTDLMGGSVCDNVATDSPITFLFSAKIGSSNEDKESVFASRREAWLAKEEIQETSGTGEQGAWQSS